MIYEKMVKELQAEKGDLIKKREKLKQEYREMKHDDQMKPHLLSKIQQIEKELEADYYKILEDRGEEIPSVPKSRAPQAALIDKKFKEKSIEEDERIKEIKKNYA